MESERDLPFEKQKAREMGCVDAVERREVHELRTKLRSAESIATYEYSFDWKADGIDISREDASMKRLCSYICKVSLFIKSDPGQTLCPQEVKKMIKDDFSSRRVFDETEQEMAHHAAFVWKRASSFVGREDLLRSIMANIAAGNNRIVVIHGVSGAGSAFFDSRLFAGDQVLAQARRR